MWIQHDTGARQNAVGRERQEHAPGRRAALQRRDRQVSVGQQNVASQIVDAVDVVPGGVGRTLGGFDAVQVHSVAPEIRPAHEHDDASRPPERPCVSAAQSPALRRGERSVGRRVAHA